MLSPVTSSSPGLMLPPADAPANFNPNPETSYDVRTRCESYLSFDLHIDSTIDAI